MKSKKINLFVFAIIFCNIAFSQSYKQALEKVNQYLKTFDNGYYGYLEVKDGYLYDRFKDGNNYCRAKLADLNKAYEKEANRKVELPCKGTENCLFSTFTNQYYGSFSFSQSSDFNSAELITLLNNLVAAYNKTNTNDDDWVDEDFELTDKQKIAFSNLTEKTTDNNTTQKNTSPGNYQTALKKLNDYLKTFDNGYYGYFEVKDGYIYDRFKAGKYNKFKMEDMEGAIIQPEYSRVIFKCKSGNCISTDWKENGKEEYTQFINGSTYNYQELATLLNNFRDAYTGNKQTAANNSTVSTNKSREQQARERNQSSTKTSSTNDIKTKNNNNDEDFEALESTAATLQNAVSEYEKASNSKTIAANTKVKLNDVFNKNSNYNDAKKYFGQVGITQTLMTFSGDNYFRGKIKFEDGTVMYFDNAVLEVVTTNSTSSISTNTKYIEPLKKLNDYLKIFNPETYDKVEVKDGKIYFYFKVYTMVYNSSISISDLKQNTTIFKANAVGEFGKAEIKIFCKNDGKYFYSTYSKGNADHFRFFSNTVKDLTTMKQLVDDFVKAL